MLVYHFDQSGDNRDTSEIPKYNICPNLDEDWMSIYRPFPRREIRLKERSYTWENRRAKMTKTKRDHKVFFLYSIKKKPSIKRRRSPDKQIEEQKTLR